MDHMENTKLDAASVEKVAFTREQELQSGLDLTVEAQQNGWERPIGYLIEQPETDPTQQLESESEPEQQPEAEIQPQEQPEEYEMPETKKKPKRKPMPKWLWAVIAAGAAIVLVVASGLLTATFVSRGWEEKLDLQAQAFDEKLAAMKNAIPQNPGNNQDSSGIVPAPVEGMTPAQVYEQNVAAVVAVINRGTTTNFYGQVSETGSSGTGFIISDNGYVLTNYHVIEGATSLTVMTVDGGEHPAQLIGYDKTNELALIKFEGENLPCVTIGSSNAMVVGDQVVAIGNPLGKLTSTLTVGYISAKDRIVNTDGVAINMLQTDAAINSGNSGGPLFNMKGEVIGITTAKFSGMSNSGVSIEGIGFAIPMDDVISMVDDLKAYGYVSGAYLGVEVKDVDEAAQSYGVPVGACIGKVVEGSAAEKAGLQVKDIIINLGGYEVRSENELIRVLRKFDGGESTTITVYRSGQTIELDIVLGVKPKPTEGQTQIPQQVEPTLPEDEYWWGWNPFFGF